MKKVLNIPDNEEMTTIEDHVKSSVLLKNLNSSMSFDYELNDKATKAKLLKAAKRIPIETEEHSSSSNLIFSAGAWYHAVLPAVKYWNDVKGEKTCKVGDYIIKVGGVKSAKESSGKHVNSKVVFFADRDKVVCHLYNTTQLILINGHGYKKFIDLFLKPFFVSKTSECIEEIEQVNDEVVRKFGSKTVKRTDIKFKRGLSFPCHGCDFSAKSVATLKKHKKSEHVISFNSSKPMHSTRNNSVIENLMIEDVTTTNLTNDSINILQENVLKYTCNECMFVSTSKNQIDEHVKLMHQADKNEEVRFVCIICQHEFSVVDDYERHVQMHERVNDKDEKNRDNVNLDNKENNYSCKQCDFSTDKDQCLKVHIQTNHQLTKVDVNFINRKKIKCESCDYECKLNIQMKKHVKEKHSPSYTCNLCDFSAEFIGEIWNHKLDKHAGDTFNFNNLDENARKNLLFNLVAEQNADLMEEIINLKKTLKEVLGQVITEFEDNMNDFKDHSKKQHVETTKALSDLQKQMTNLERTDKPNVKPKVAKPAAQSPSPATPSSSAASLSVGKSGANQSRRPEATKPRRKTDYQRKCRALIVGDSLAHNTNFRKVEIVTNSTIKTAKAYSSVWDKSARYKELNVTDVVKNELKNASFNHLVLAAPTVDISNIDTAKVKPTDNTDAFKQKIGISCENMIKVAEDALANNTDLKKVTIMSHAPRYDTRDVDPVGLKPNLANFANSYFLELWLNSPMKDKIFIGSHNLECSADVKMKRYRDEHSGRYDGVHLYGSAGKTAYTASVLNILLSSFETPAPAQVHSNQTRQPTDDYHTNCPQAQYSKKQKQKYSSVVAGKSSIKTQNRFSPLGEFSGNF